MTRKPHKSTKPSPRLRRAQETNGAVERILASTDKLWSDLGPIPGAQENVRRLRRGESAWWSPAVREQIRPADLVSVTDHIARNAVVDLWRKQGRIAYDINPEMAAALYRADMKGKLPGGLFRRLPHISPMVPLPRPWPFRAPNKREGLIRAYFLTGHIGQGFCRTTDERSEGLVVMPWIEWNDARQDEYGDVVTPLFRLPSAEDPFSLDDVIEQTNAWQGTRTDGNERRLLRQILPGFMSVMTYLCCDNRDVEEPPPAPAAKGKKKRQAPPRDPFYVRVGWHVGPALHAARVRAQQAATRDGVSVPSGVEYGPQHRAGHYKVVRHGPRRSLESLRWVDPYWTKWELLKEGQEPGTGVIPVNPQRKDPANHRDVRLANLGRAKEQEIRERERQRAREGSFEW
ncbi:hypothetical protein [Actinacidiphila sp. ITFR-21]|uniref:hypothetical protein n=1 Tax=Actinacidiphila sp. ITFR-21 TaxID=3075199 RepID=UPI00288BEC1E|nr:hypothetical protein [Streptomyces sp. ITFR-21]WNI20144.1 hypothetical protein RLT57_31900 [Streptomyces sp. ITFR-21]